MAKSLKIKCGGYRKSTVAAISEGPGDATELLAVNDPVKLGKKQEPRQFLGPIALSFILFAPTVVVPFIFKPIASL